VGTVDHDVLLAKPDGRVRQVDEPLLILEQLLSCDLPSFARHRLQQVLDALPPQLGNAVVVAGIASTRPGESFVEIGVACVGLDVAPDAKRLRMALDERRVARCANSAETPLASSPFGVES
jgi:hypothetical protein